MTEPIAFDARSARHALPLLVAGQAQKEFFVNEAFARIDALLHPAVEGEATEPPGSPAPGECWLVAAPASGAWALREGELASWDGTQWTFCAPAKACCCSTDRPARGSSFAADGSGFRGPPPLPGARSSMPKRGRQLPQLATCLQHSDSFRLSDGNRMPAPPFGSHGRGTISRNPF